MNAHGDADKMENIKTQTTRNKQEDKNVSCSGYDEKIFVRHTVAAAVNNIIRIAFSFQWLLLPARSYSLVL